MCACVSVPVGSYRRVHESSGLGVDEPLEDDALAATRCLWPGTEAWRERVPPSGQGGRQAWGEEGPAGEVGARVKTFQGEGGAKAICATKKQKRTPFRSPASALSALARIVAARVRGTTVKKEQGVNPRRCCIRGCWE